MSNRDEPPLSQAPPGHGPNVAGAGVVSQVVALLRALRGSAYGWRLALLAGGIVVVVCANAFGQIQLNAWQGAFFDALEQLSAEIFIHQLLVFTIIVSGLLVLAVGQTWLNEMIKVRLREWLTNDLLDEWLAPKRAHRLALSGDIGVHPDQRMQEDARNLTELSTDLGIGLLQASLLLVSFVGVLWMLSAQVMFTIGERSFAIPGYMVWCALAYACAGSWLTWRVGRPLIQLNAERYAREAELRFTLVRVSECAEAIALHGGEADERRLLNTTVDRVVTITGQLANGLARLTWVTSGYGWLAIVAPILVAAPGYFGGSLSLGGLMMVVGAFIQVQQSLRWFVDNFARIADWRATLLRVAAFRDALLSVDTPGDGNGGIRLANHPAGNLAFEHLSLFLSDSRIVLNEARLEVSPGERVLIVEDTGSGKAALFRALAGLWSWGAGTIHLPPRPSMMFMPQRPYLPLGTLRTALSYPADPGAFSDDAVNTALERVGLSHLAPSLNRETRWDKHLPLDEQQRLAFARLLLHAPQWVIINGATSALDEEHRQAMTSIFERELAGTAVIGVARVPTRDGLYSRIVQLRRIPEIAHLPRRRTLRSEQQGLSAEPRRAAIPATGLADGS